MSRPLAALVMGVLLVGCTTGTESVAEFDRAYPMGRMTTLRRENIDDVVGRLRKHFGQTPIRVRSVMLNTERIVFDVEDPKNRSHVDLYMFLRGSELDPRPDKSSAGRSFELDVSDLYAAAGAARKALDAAHTEDGHVESVSLDLDAAGEKQFAVRIEGPRTDGLTVHVRLDGAPIPD